MIGINNGSFFTFSTIFLEAISIAVFTYLIAVSLSPFIKLIFDNS